MKWWLSALAALCLSGMAAQAQSLFGQRTDYATVAFHSGIAGEDGTRIAALRMELKPGWKTYWRVPGDSGVPPHFDWSGSENLRSATTSWPVPRVFTAYGDRTIGYETRMVVPLTLTPEDPSRPLRIRLNFTYGVCADICIPAGQSFDVDIPPGAPEDGAYFVQRAMADRLGPAPEGALSAITCELHDRGDGKWIQVSFRATEPFQAPPTIVAEAPHAEIGRMETQQAADRIVGAAPILSTDSGWVDRAALRLTILGDGRGMVTTGCNRT